MWCVEGADWGSGGREGEGAKYSCCNWPRVTLFGGTMDDWSPCT